MFFMFLQEENKKKLSEILPITKCVWCVFSISICLSVLFVGLYECVHAPFHLFIETRKRRKNYRPTHLHLFFSKIEREEINIHNNISLLRYINFNVFDSVFLFYFL